MKEYLEIAKAKIGQILSYKSSRFKKIIIISWIIFLGLFTGIPAIIYAVSVDFAGLFGGMPPLNVLENPENDLSSELFFEDGVTMGRYYRYNRSEVQFEDLSEELVTTLIDSEDIRHFDHSGLDFIAYMRVLKGILTFNLAGGGSTLTQQLAKNLFTQNQEFGLDGKIASWGRWPRRIVQKLKEWIISVHLERNFTKKEILAMYLNTSSFSSNAYGIKIAAETYFGTSPDSLNWEQSAVLVGMLRAVTRFNPVLNYDNSIQQRNAVLYKVQKYGDISKETYDSLKELPIDLSKYKVSSHNRGLATYFREHIRLELIRLMQAKGYDIYEDGLKIYTTLNSKMQEYAEESVRAHMPQLQDLFFELWEGRNPWIDDDKKEIEGFLENEIKDTPAYENLVNRFGENSDSIDFYLNEPKKMTVFSWQGEIDTLLSSMDSLKYYKHFLHTGFMSMDPHTGQIRAWVGGINQKYFQYDHVKQGTRQPGSTFKTFVYGLAMKENYSPCQTFIDISPTFNTIQGPWRPVNADGTYGSGDEMTMRQAMARSVNSITAQVMKKVGPENVVQFANDVGITHTLDPVPSLCLGTSDVSIFDIVGAYSTFVNKGIHIKPYYISRIEDKNGNIIYSHIPDSKQGVDEQTAYKLLHMLKGGVEEEGGTSRGLSIAVKEDNEIGGKTGTTNNASDGWYVGLTKDLVSGCWVGGDSRNIHFERWVDGSGARTARPIWDIFMQKVYADSSLNITKGPFPRPVRGLDMELDCNQYDESDTTVVVEEVWDPNDIND